MRIEFKHLIAVLVAHIACACSSTTIYNAQSQSKGNFQVLSIHVPAESDDVDVDGTSYPDEHFSIVIKNDTDNPMTAMNAIADSDYSDITAIGIASSNSGKTVTDTQYLCGTTSPITDTIAGTFECRVSMSTIKDNPKIIILFRMKNGETWKSKEVDAMVTKNEWSKVKEQIAAKNLSTPTVTSDPSLTLKSCPDVDGKHSDEVTSDKLCPGDCLPPTGYFDTTTHQCVSILQPKKPCPDGQLLQIDGTSCATNCGPNQDALPNSCKCTTGYIKDPAAKTCIVDPTFNASTSTSTSTSTDSGSGTSDSSMKKFFGCTLIRGDTL